MRDEPGSVDCAARQLEEASPDLLRAMVKEMTETLMSAEWCALGDASVYVATDVHAERDVVVA